MTTNHLDKLISKANMVQHHLTYGKDNLQELDLAMNSVIDLLDEMEEIITTNW